MIFKQLTINLDIYISIFQVGLANLPGNAKNEHGRVVRDEFSRPGWLRLNRRGHGRLATFRRPEEGSLESSRDGRCPS
jgi:hypothetical protein